MKLNILYIFGGEKAQGAEIVIERLISFNQENVNAHLFISPGKFADKLKQQHKTYPLLLIEDLKKLNRSSSSPVQFYIKALKNYCTISYKAGRYVLKNRIDIIHANTIVPSSYLIPLIIFSKLFSRKTKFIWSDHDFKNPSRLDHFFSKVCVLLYDYTLTPSYFVKNKYKKNRKILVLYNGLNPNTFKEDMDIRNDFRSKYFLCKNIIAIGIAASIVPRKGQLELIEAFKDLTLNFPNLLLIIAGNYGHNLEYNQNVKTAIKDNNKIVYTGFIDNMISFYNGCDIIINNSDIVESEPLGTTIYEAMSCGKIVMASNTGGTREIITDNKDGFLFEPENRSDLIKKLTYVIQNYSCLNEIKISARNKVVQKFNITTMKDEYNKIIDCLYPK